MIKPAHIKIAIFTFIGPLWGGLMVSFSVPFKTMLVYAVGMIPALLAGLWYVYFEPRTSVNRVLLGAASGFMGVALLVVPLLFNLTGIGFVFALLLSLAGVPAGCLCAWICSQLYQHPAYISSMRRLKRKH